MAKLNTKKASITHRVLIFGPPKSGKTQLAGALAEHYKIIWVDFERGHDTLFKMPEDWQKNIELIDIPDTNDFPIAIETALKMIRGAVKICDLHGKVSCARCTKEGKGIVTVDLTSLDQDTVVVFDSLTQLSNSAIAHITKDQPDDYKLKIDDWGHLGKLLDIFLSALQQAKYNVIVISHEVEATTEGKKSVLVPVAGTRNSSRNVAKYFDHVIYAEKKNKKHNFASGTDYSTTVLTGSRTDVKMEDAKGEASLLAIFKPELYAEKEKLIKANVSTTGSDKAAALLARIKAKSSSSP